MDAKLKSPLAAAVATVAAASMTAAWCYAASRRQQHRRDEGDSQHETDTERRQKLRMDRGTMEQLVIEAVKEGDIGWEEGGIPIGAVIADEVLNLLSPV